MHGIDLWGYRSIDPFEVGERPQAPKRDYRPILKSCLFYSPSPSVIADGMNGWRYSASH